MDVYLPTALERYHINSYCGLNKKKCRLHIPKGEKRIIQDYKIYKDFKFLIEY